MAIDGAILLNLLIAGTLTFLFGAFALVLLQRATRRHMMKTRGRPAADLDASHGAGQPAATPLAMHVLPTAKAGPEPTGLILRRMAAAHAAAGLAYAVVATTLLFSMSGIEFLPFRTAIVVWALAWPTVLVLNFLTGPDRATQFFILCGYFGVLIMLCTATTLAGTPPLEMGGIAIPAFVQPLVLWAVEAAPSIFLLLFLNRTIRTIGPLVIVFVSVLLAGSQLALSTLALEPIAVAMARVALDMGIGVYGVFSIFAAVGMAAAAWPAWTCAKWLRDRYTAKRTSDLMVTVGATWLLQTLMLSFSLARDQGVLGVAAALLPLLAWRLTLAAGLRPAVAAARGRPQLRLLLLRVFGFGRRSRRLLDLIGARWRLIGSIDLIAAPDLASRSVEPSTFMEFLSGRLGRLFIQTPADLQQRFAALDHAPDPDARYRINQLFCANDMWKNAVERLMVEASLVVMDLRGFGPQHRGCIYEVQTLLDVVPLDRLVFLFDASTDRAALESVLSDRWRQLSPGSPNLAAIDPQLRFISTADGDTKAVLRLLGTLELPRA